MEKMLFTVDGVSRLIVLLLSLATVALVGILDYFTGYLLAFSAFYLLPILSATWVNGRWAGAFLSAVSSIAWTCADVMARTSEVPLHVMVWNTCIRLTVFLITASLLAEVRRALNVERGLSRTDSLTGLSNARAYGEAIEREIAFCRRSPQTFAVAYIDLDNFKTVNDLHGHAAGDSLLQRVAACISRNIRSTDVAARLGGDEFSVFFPHTSGEEAKPSIDRIRDSVRKEMGKSGWPVTVSVGVISFEKAPPSAHSAIHCADEAMYRVKKMGKDSALYESA